MDRKAFASALGGGSATSAPLDGIVKSRASALDNTIAQRQFAGATFGLPEGYTTRDTGTGVHEILDASGKVIGTGYDDLDTTLTEWQKQNVMGSAKEVKSPAVLSGEYGDFMRGLTPEQNAKLLAEAPSHWESPYLSYQTYDDSSGNQTLLNQYKTKEELDAALEGLLKNSSTIDQVYGTRDHSEKYPSFFSAPNRWEAIGILANPQVSQGANYNGTRDAFGSPPDRTADDAYIGQFGPGAYSPGASNHNSAAAKFVGLPNTVRGNSISSPAVEEVKGQHAMYGSQPVFNNGRLIGYKVDTRLMSPEEQEKAKKYFDDYNAKSKSYRKPYQVGDYGLSSAWNRRSSATSNAMYRELNQGWDQFSKISDTEYFVPINKVGEVPGWKNTAKDSYENWSGGGGFFDKIIPAVALGALTFGIGSALGGAIAGSSFGTAIGATASKALGGAIAGGLVSGATGGNPLTGAITGGLGGAMSGWSPIGDAADSLANTAIRGVISGGVGSALNKGDIGTGMLTGGLSAAAGSYVGDMFGGSKTFSGQLAGGLARAGTGLLANAALRDTPDAPNQPTQQKSTATGYAPVEQRDMSGMNMRQRLAASMRSY